MMNEVGLALGRVALHFTECVVEENSSWFIDDSNHQQ